MKLLLCIKCSDVIALKQGKTRHCSCRKSGGRYIDNLNAEYWGEKAYLLGFANGSFVDAIRKQIKEGDLTETMEGIYAGQAKGRDFNAFIIPESASSIKKITKPVKEK